MADGMSVAVDIDPVVRAFQRLEQETARRTNEASRVTAMRIRDEARHRLQRQLGPEATGASVAGIVAEPAYDGDGWVVMADRDPYPNLPLWLEKGTKAGKRRNMARTKPRPFFYNAIELEMGPHERRLIDAMEAAGDAAGLGM